MKNKLLFLGGTCGNNDWREDFTKKLIASGVDESVIFNPVVKDWNVEAQTNEEAKKKAATHMLYYIANPKQEGIPVSAYSMVEATMALYDNPETTYVVFDYEGIESHSLKSVKQACNVLKERFPNANIFDELKAARLLIGLQLHG